jgi:type III pantothenate kinase
MNTLCFDFGNTRLKVALFQNTKLTEVIVIENDGITTIESILNKFDSQKSNPFICYQS